MNPKLLLVLGASVAVAAAAPIHADSIELLGTVRDFKVTHPDMQRTVSGYPVVTNMVLPDLGEDGTPVLNTADLSSIYRIESADSFFQWFHDAPGVNITIPYAITLDNGQSGPGGIYSFVVEKPDYFFPIDGQGWGDTATDYNGGQRNFYFTYEIRTMFKYTDPAERQEALEFAFTGDDDVWVFINGKLAVDIGGVHGQAHDSVNLDAEAGALGLVPGNVYSLDLFFAERHTTESNFRIETTIRPEPALVEAFD